MPRRRTFATSVSGGVADRRMSSATLLHLPSRPPGDLGLEIFRPRRRPLLTSRAPGRPGGVPGIIRLCEICPRPLVHAAGARHADAGIQRGVSHVGNLEGGIRSPTDSDSVRRR